MRICNRSEVGELVSVLSIVMACVIGGAFFAGIKYQEHKTATEDVLSDDFDTVNVKAGFLDDVMPHWSSASIRPFSHESFPARDVFFRGVYVNSGFNQRFNGKIEATRSMAATVTEADLQVRTLAKISQSKYMVRAIGAGGEIQLAQFLVFLFVSADRGKWYVARIKDDKGVPHLVQAEADGDECWSLCTADGAYWPRRSVETVTCLPAK